jgi:uncharacterized membrane protein SirB2
MEAESKKYPTLVIVSLICSGVILLGIYPYRPNDLLGWVVLLLISVPVVLFYEVLGKKLLENKRLNSAGRLTRIVYGVIALGLVIIASVSVVSWLEPYLGKWGS